MQVDSFGFTKEAFVSLPWLFDSKFAFKLLIKGRNINIFSFCLLRSCFWWLVGGRDMLSMFLRHFEKKFTADVWSFFCCFLSSCCFWVFNDWSVGIGGFLFLWILILCCYYCYCYSWNCCYAWKLVNEWFMFFYIRGLPYPNLLALLKFQRLKGILFRFLLFAWVVSFYLSFDFSRYCKSKIIKGNYEND